MRLIKNRFWIAWTTLLLLMVGYCFANYKSTDMALLGGACALSLLSAWLCHKIRSRVAFGNIIIMIVYNAVLAYNIAFNSQYGACFTWWFYSLLLNAIHSVVLLLYTLIMRLRCKAYKREQ